MQSAWTTWPAPAKLNLFLHIVGRRADGYHLLQTVFQLLDWGDRVRLRVREDGAIVRAAELPQIAIETDLCVRAARALQAASGCRRGVEIALDKRIPIGAGLGGGSSDAATVLLALDALWDTRLPRDELARIGLALGADVPVFVHGYSAWAEGIGEQITPLELPLRHYVIVDPGVSVATAPLFQAAELTRNSPPTTIENFLASAAMSNVFAAPVRARYREVAAAMDWLARFGEARLTGSGGCVFAAFAQAEAADAVARECPQPLRAYRARGVNRSPLHEALERGREHSRTD